MRRGIMPAFLREVEKMGSGDVVPLLTAYIILVLQLPLFAGGSPPWDRWSAAAQNASNLQSHLVCLS
jgi:hypothetical protein